MLRLFRRAAGVEFAAQHCSRGNLRPAEKREQGASGSPPGRVALRQFCDCLFIVTSPLVDFCTRELYRLHAGLKIDSALEILPSVRASHAEMTVIQSNVVHVVT